MTHVYIEYNFKVVPKEPATEILIAELAEVGFESFDETPTGVLAYIPEDQYRENILKEVNILNSIVFRISYRKKVIQPENWNAKWESEFQPIEINDKCRIRAPFHAKKNVDYEILINPKMAFGTGHHATTHLMIEYLLAEELHSKKVLDMGCGTGVLAILAAMRQAASIEAIDVDSWSYENTIENCQLNNIDTIHVQEGDARLLTHKKFDIIFANINRNILLNDMPTYATCLPKSGILFMSGYYEKDLARIKNRAEELGLVYQNHQVREDWTAAKFIKIR